MKEHDEFYIGWQDKASPVYTGARRVFFWISFFVMISFGILYLAFEKPFIDSYFDYVNLTKLEGTVVEYPVFGLKTVVDNRTVTVPLVGFGKFDARPVLDKLRSKANGQSLGDFKVTLEGTLIQYREKTWMELTEGEQSIISMDKTDRSATQSIRSGGEQNISGEIVDPKCFFGVMNPAWKKIHRSCAIRCISGGIPPVLAVRDGEDFSDYYFVTDEAGRPVNKEVLQYVGIPLHLSGQVEQVDDWKVIKINARSLSSVRLDYSGWVSECRTAHTSHP